MAETEKKVGPTPPEAIGRDELTKLLRRAERGDKGCLPQLRAQLRAEADGRSGGRLLELYGDPPSWLRANLAANVGGKNLAVTEAAEVRMDQLRRELDGLSPSPLERLLAERAVLCWFLVHTYETTYAQSRELTIRQAEFQQRRIDAAHRRFLSAVRTLAQIRKLALPALQMNIGANQLNVARGSGGAP
jgi:hypothetical protein